MRTAEMTGRRQLLLGAALLPLLALPALAAEPKRPVARRTPKPEAPVGSPAQTPIGPVDVLAKWAIVLDFNSGATLLDKDADLPIPPSSMTKLMTAYIVYGMLRAGRLKLDQQLPVSERAWRMGGSKMFVQIGSTVSVDDLIRGMIIQSGNDACIVLAEAISGSEEQFAELMNQKAKELGLTHSHFRNATGWPDPEHVMSVRDIAIVARHIIADFPEYYHYDSEKSFKYNNIDQMNRNALVQKGIADGLKTGHTEAGGYGLVASAARGGRRVIVVVNGLSTNRERGEEGERLLDWAFREFEDVNLFAAGDVIDTARVWLGEQTSVPLVVDQGLVLTLPRGWRDRIKVSTQFAAPVPAPVRKGDVLGKLMISGQGVPAAEQNLRAGADVARLGLPQRGLAVLAHFVTGS